MRKSFNQVNIYMYSFKIGRKNGTKTHDAKNVT